MAGGASWFSSHIPLVGKLGVFGASPVSNIAKMAANGVRTVGSFVSGKPIKKKGWWSSFLPF